MVILVKAVEIKLISLKLHSCVEIKELREIIFVNGFASLVEKQERLTSILEAKFFFLLQVLFGFDLSCLCEEGVLITGYDLVSDKPTEEAKSRSHYDGYFVILASSSRSPP